MGKGQDPLTSDDNRHIGKVLDNKYELLEVLGSKGAVNVYRGQHVDTNRIVAVEILHDSLVTDSDLVKRFDREARACMAIEHENIVDIFEVGRTSWGAPFMVLEYLEGRSLAELIETQGPLDMETSLDMMAPILHALAAAHDKGFVHRGLTSENVVVIRREDGSRVVKLVDFGRTKFLLDAEAAASPRAPDSRYPTEYAAPEQADPASEADFRCDLFSAGVIYYEMLAGRRPFAGSTAAEREEALSAKTYLTPDETGADFPKRALPIIERALQAQPEKRYGSGVEMLEEILHTTLSEPDDTGGTAQFFFPKNQESGRAKKELEPELELASLDDGDDTKDEELKWGSAYYFEDHTAMYGQKVPRPSLSDVSAKGFIASDAPPAQPIATPARSLELADQEDSPPPQRVVYILYFTLFLLVVAGLLAGGWLLYDGLSRAVSAKAPPGSADSEEAHTIAQASLPTGTEGGEPPSDSDTPPSISPPVQKTAAHADETNTKRRDRPKDTDKETDSAAEARSLEKPAPKKEPLREDAVPDTGLDPDTQAAPNEASQDETYAQMVLRQFRARRDLIEKCQEKHLARRPYTTGGHFTLDITIDRSGRITDFAVVEDTLEDEAAVSCVTKILRPWIYTAPPGPSAVISKTFRFPKPKPTPRKRPTGSPDPASPTPSPTAPAAPAPVPAPDPKPIEDNPFE